MSNSATPDESLINGVIRAELARKQRTQGGLAGHLRLSQTAVNRRMSGRVSWRLSELRSAADYLDISLGDLVNAGEASV
ncbi:helix-turn-helix domain-containing protein [Mycolicibacterium llatzerense]|uniref:helix-turn-helix domain-containing protein n=1 Tax=Mycolicibacterium llatzerense TaxID=280871 RepID=UPI0021B6028A|nr:helix-turn-helix domain-containing protein [Mycolicibacterium llatzerense]MCT7372742.1 hypothetical protein [Mycolicibacterium llatzerense]